MDWEGINSNGLAFQLDSISPSPPPLTRSWDEIGVSDINELSLFESLSDSKKQEMLVALRVWDRRHLPAITATGTDQKIEYQP